MVILSVAMLSLQLFAQKEQFNPIYTGVTSLSIAPDARAGRYCGAIWLPACLMALFSNVSGTVQPRAVSRFPRVCISLVLILCRAEPNPLRVQLNSWL